MLYSILKGAGMGKKFAYDIECEADVTTFWHGEYIKNNIVTIQRPDGTILKTSTEGLRMQADCKIDSFKNHLYLPNISGQLIFRKDFVEELKNWLGNQLQFFDMELTTKDAVSHDYQVANITNKVKSFDLEKSDLIWFDDMKSIRRIKQLIFKEDSCMQGLHIAREYFEPISIVVTEKFKIFCEEHKVKDLYFRKGTEYM